MTGFGQIWVDPCSITHRVHRMRAPYVVDLPSLPMSKMPAVIREIGKGTLPTGRLNRCYFFRVFTS